VHARRRAEGAGVCPGAGASESRCLVLPGALLPGPGLAGLAGSGIAGAAHEGVCPSPVGKPAKRLAGHGPGPAAPVGLSGTNRPDRQRGDRSGAGHGN
jgi:hypothetical protein